MCIRRLFYGKGRRAYDIATPSPSEIESAILGIEGEQVQGVHLVLHKGLLTVSGDTSNRMQVHYIADKHDMTEPECMNGLLLDSQYSEKDGTIEMNLSGMYDDVPLYQTVEKAVVLQVLKYYSEHCSFPDDLVWKRW